MTERKDFRSFDNWVQNFQNELNSSSKTVERAMNTSPKKGPGRYSFKPVAYQFRNAQA